MSIFWISLTQQMHLILTVYFINLVLYITPPTHFDANALSSGSSYSLPAKLHKCVPAVFVVFL
jgi:hypothetical protein